MGRLLRSSAQCRGTLRGTVSSTRRQHARGHGDGYGSGNLHPPLRRDGAEFVRAEKQELEEQLCVPSEAIEYFKTIAEPAAAGNTK